MFDPLDFLKLCKEISSYSTIREEALRRTQIGRSYYASHLIAREKVRRYYPYLLKNLRKRGEEHSVVRDKLKACGHGNISDKLYSLSRYRGTADYDLTQPVGTSSLTKAIRLSEDIVSLVQQIRSL
jgi:hypothetical protein